MMATACWHHFDKRAGASTGQGSGDDDARCRCLCGSLDLPVFGF